MRADEIFVGAVELEAFAKCIDLGVGFESFRHAGRHQHDATHRIAGVEGRERAVDNIYAFDLFGRDHAPTRRGGKTVVGEIGKQQAIRIDNRLRTGDRRIGAHLYNGVAVADVTFAHMDAGQVLDHFGGRDGVGGFGDLPGGDALGRRRQVCRNGRLVALDDHFAELLVDILIGGKCHRRWHKSSNDSQEKRIESEITVTHVQNPQNIRPLRATKNAASSAPTRSEMQFLRCWRAARRP